MWCPAGARQRGGSTNTAHLCIQPAAPLTNRVPLPTAPSAVYLPGVKQRRVSAHTPTQTRRVWSYIFGTVGVLQARQPLVGLCSWWCLQPGADPRHLAESSIGLSVEEERKRAAMSGRQEEGNTAARAAARSAGCGTTAPQPLATSTARAVQLYSLVDDADEPHSHSTRYSWSESSDPSTTCATPSGRCCNTRLIRRSSLAGRGRVYTPPKALQHLGQPNWSSTGPPFAAAAAAAINETANLGLSSAACVPSTPCSVRPPVNDDPADSGPLASGIVCVHASAASTHGTSLR